MSADQDSQDYASKYAICPKCKGTSTKFDVTPARSPLCKAHYKLVIPTNASNIFYVKSYSASKTNDKLKRAY